MEKETLEDAAEKYVEDFELSFYDTIEEIPVKEMGKKDFIEGAKYQAERMYSEEEVDTLLEMLKRSIAEINHIKHTYKDRGHCVKYLSDCESAIEQFKKK
jgi:hypothetical protein